jgi:hypothetical protein
MPLVLASASFDSTVRLWDVEKFRYHFFFFFMAGTWTNNANMPLVLAFASFDSTSRAQECGEVQS